MGKRASLDLRQGRLLLPPIERAKSCLLSSPIIFLFSEPKSVPIMTALCCDSTSDFTQVLPLTQFRHLSVLQSSFIVKKCVFYKYTLKVYVSYFNGVCDHPTYYRDTPDNALVSLKFQKQCTRRVYEGPSKVSSQKALPLGSKT